MSDKVELRNKLLSKLVKKASKLNESIQLFSKFDKKISLNQTGGNMHNIGIKLASIEHYAVRLQDRLGDLNALVGHYDAATNTILQRLQGLRLNQFSHLTNQEYQNAQTIFNPVNNANIIPNVKRFIQFLLTNKRNAPFAAAADGYYNTVYNTMRDHAACKIAEDAVLFAARTAAAAGGAATAANVRQAAVAAGATAVPPNLPVARNLLATTAAQAVVNDVAAGGAVTAAAVILAFEDAAAAAATARIAALNITTHAEANTTLEPADGTVTRLSDLEKKQTLATLMEQAAIHSPAILV